MDDLLKLFKRYVEAMEKIADALSEMNADGVTIKGAAVTGGEEAGSEEASEETEEDAGEEDAGEEAGEETEEETTLEDEGEKELDFETVRARIRGFSDSNGEAAAIALLKKLKATKISTLKEEHYQEAMDYIAKNEKKPKK